MKIGAIDLSPAFALAPMAGMTDTAFRRLVKREGGCGLVVTEMVSSEGLVRGIDLDELRPKEPDTGAALTIFKEMEFSRFVRDLTPAGGSSGAAAARSGLRASAPQAASVDAPADYRHACGPRQS